MPRRRWLWPSSGNAASRCVMWDGMHMHMQEDCVAELRLRALPASVRTGSLCPFNCSDNGTCAVAATAPRPGDFYDEDFPGEIQAIEAPAEPASAQLWSSVPAQDACICNKSPPRKGTWCEHELETLEFGIWTDHIQLPPLRWKPHRAPIKPDGGHALRIELQVLLLRPSLPGATSVGLPSHQSCPVAFWRCRHHYSNLIACHRSRRVAAVRLVGWMAAACDALLSGIAASSPPPRPPSSPREPWVRPANSTSADFSWKAGRDDVCVASQLCSCTPHAGEPLAAYPCTPQHA